MGSKATTGLVGLVLSQLFFALIFFSGIVAAGLGRPAFAVATVVVGAAITLFWMNLMRPSPAVGAWRGGIAAIAIGALTLLVVRQVFREGPITLQRVQGAIAVYLLVGLFWANLYVLIEELLPGAFRMPQSPTGPGDVLASFAYYSFVTLTTMGYGDILPIHPVARSAAVLEALVGQLFPAILIARLVAMELSSRPPR